MAGRGEAAQLLWQDAAAYARLHEAELNEVFGLFVFIGVMQKAIVGGGMFFA